MTPAGRLPDFVIIGTMKSGSTTLYRWLGLHPGCSLPAAKEPNFFSHDEVWARGAGWYGSLFAGAGQGQTGEASVSCTDPARAAVAARRLSETVPSARLVCVLRDPVERLRSHYRHEVQRGRERRPLATALAEPGNAYVARSRYAAGLRPWVERFGREQLCVVRLEDLTGDGGGTWERLQRHVGLEPVPRPAEVFNATAGKAQFTRGLRVLWERGLLPDTGSWPAPVRRAGRRLLLRSGGRYAELIEGSRASLPPDALAAVRGEAASLPALVGDGALRW